MARILVADDEAGLREFMADALSLDGHTVEQAEDGESAQRALEARGFDLLVTDLRMPRLDGLELLRRVKGQQPELEVLVLTAHGNVGNAVDAMKLGAFDFLQKPLEGPDQLRLLVKRALERRQLRDAHASVPPDRHAVPLTYGDPAMRPVVEALQKVARTEATVLLLGESGSGKEVAARALHAQSPRHQQPFAAVNCAALTENLLESELFGHEKGAFTGATERKRGRLELAAGGTFFLDEVAELKPELQAKLLRVLQEKRFERVGGSQTLEADVRWVAATHRDLKKEMGAGRFREDLYHRLAVFPIHLPALRERRSDILPLARSLLVRVAQELKRPPLQLSAESEVLIQAAPWRGNVRELANTLERAAILADGTILQPEHLSLDSAADDARSPTAGASETGTLAELERSSILRALEQVGGNRRKAAELLGIGERTLYEKLKRYGGA